jgi:hypothetical protein
MTILNQANDGRHPELIVLARAVVYAGSISQEDLIASCAVGNPVRLRGAVSRWTTSGLFVESAGGIRIAPSFAKKRGESVDDWTLRLPKLLRSLTMMSQNCLPLYGEGEGICADFVRGISWALAQDIFSFPRTFEGDNGVESLQSQVRQFQIFQNNTRWPSFRAWSRYFGLATGTGNSFRIDPTSAIKDELPDIFKGTTSMTADVFLGELAKRIPVLDAGVYRSTIEEFMDETKWKRTAISHLSMSLSFALNRLQLDQAIVCEHKSDSGQGFVFTTKEYLPGQRFTHVRLLRGAT